MTAGRRPDSKYLRLGGLPQPLFISLLLGMHCSTGMALSLPLPLLLQELFRSWGTTERPLKENTEITPLLQMPQQVLHSSESFRLGPTVFEGIRAGAIPAFRQSPSVLQLSENHPFILVEASFAVLNSITDFPEIAPAGKNCYQHKAYIANQTQTTTSSPCTATKTSLCRHQRDTKADRQGGSTMQLHNCPWKKLPPSLVTARHQRQSTGTEPVLMSFLQASRL